MKTLTEALASVNADTTCTVCGRAANNGYVNVNAREACVAIIHDAYGVGTLTRRAVRAELVRKWERTKRPRLLGIPGTGLLDMKRRDAYNRKQA